MPEANINGITDSLSVGPSWEARNGRLIPVVLLSNSLSSNLSMWDRQVGALLENGYRVLRYDSRGHGASSAHLMNHILFLCWRRTRLAC